MNRHHSNKGWESSAEGSDLEGAVSETVDDWGFEGNLLTESIVETLVGEPGVFERLCGAHPPALALHQQTGDEVFGLVWDVGELVHLKVPLAGQDVVERLVVVVAQERRQAAEPGARRGLATAAGARPACACACVYSQHVSDDAEAPHVSGEWNKLIVDDLGG